jgi:cell division inhibitor SulA
MNDLPSAFSISLPLEQILLRDDICRGALPLDGIPLDGALSGNPNSTHRKVKTGFEALDKGLLNQGWPLGSFIEICQQKMQAEWQLLTPALRNLSGLIVLLNPPQVPFCQALIQVGIDLERLVVVAASDKRHFIACFIELARASVGAIMAWQPNDNLSYTELRKCALAAADGTGLCVMFRPSAMQQQSSPAALRIFARLASAGLELTLFKQKGFLQTQQPRPIVIALPDIWKPIAPYYLLNQKADTSKPKRRLASVTPLRGKR